MRRSLWSRLLAIWLACWLPLVLTDGGGMSACPMHGGAMTGATMHGAMMSVPAAAPVARHATDVADGVMQHPAPGHGHHGAHTCTCAGDCCPPMAALAAGEPPPFTVASTTRHVVATAARSDAEYVAAWVDFVLPFANAPPERASA